MEERSLRITGTDKTFFNKITNTLTKILIPTKIGLNGMLISIKRNSLLKAYENYVSDENNNEELEKKYNTAYEAYLESLDKYVMDSVYKKVKNNTASEFEKNALAKYYEVTSLKENEYNEYRYRKTCCKECHCKLLQQIQADLLSSGKHTAWKTRDNLSYAEKFWMDILVVNNIKFEHNMPYRCDNTCYFLDFYLYPNIDLEIDGKQHNYADRKAHDELRDSRLTKCGITVYRIPVVSLKNPDKVKKQVDEFLEWYMNIRNDLSNDTNS